MSDKVLGVHIKSDGTSVGTEVTYDGKVLPVTEMTVHAKAGGEVTVTLKMYVDHIDADVLAKLDIDHTPLAIRRDEMYPKH